MRLRLLPIVVFAGSALLVLKVLGLALGEHYPIGAVRMADAQQAPVSDVSEEMPAVLPDPSGARPIVVAQGPALGGGGGNNTVSELAVLNSLGDRRKLLDKREQDLDLREQVLKATEAKLEKRMQELKALEAKLDQRRKVQEQQATDEIMDLVKIYESMKAKNAARIFDRLDLDIMLKVVKQMQPRKMADVLSEMDPEMAERLTIALAAGQARPDALPAPGMLPKIQGN